MSVENDGSVWFSSILERFYASLRQVEQRNYDFTRFGPEGENVLDVPWHAIQMFVISQAWQAFFRSRMLLRDEPSRQLFDLLILFRLAGHLHIRLPYSNSSYWNTVEQVRLLRQGEAPERGAFGPLYFFDLPLPDNRIRLKCWDVNVLCSFLLRQYFYERDQVRIQPETGDTALDLGACFGDTALAFASAVGESGCVHSFDFMPLHAAILQQNLEMNPQLSSRVRFHAFGVGAEDSEAKNGCTRATIDPGARVDTDSVPIRSIDSLVASGEVQRVDFIKMDIEGSELDALKGAVKTLRQFKPKLAISLYHRPQDFVVIPQFLASLELGYEFHLNHYTIHSEETVLYAAVNSSRS
ncbi:MAG TPA: FkbM family methyltransferase [Terracidiphilus sp.]|nr:FkbM family methyltransferase [Terracidiphilus sp.]